MHNTFCMTVPGGGLELEVFTGVVIADAAHDSGQRLEVGRVFATRDPVADLAAYQAAEIIVARIRSEAARIGHHADKHTQYAMIAEADQLLQIAFLVIVEP